MKQEASASRCLSAYLASIYNMGQVGKIFTYTLLKTF